MIRVRRTRLSTGDVQESEVSSVRQAKQLVAWCATDNLNMSRAEASGAAELAGQAFAVGSVFHLGGAYDFEVVS